MRVQGESESSQLTQTGLSQSGGPIPAGQPPARLRWRAVVHARQSVDAAHGQQPIAWHLADCDDPARPEAHCDIGRHLLASDGNPEGHCRVAGTCPRCPEGTSHGGGQI